MCGLDRAGNQREEGGDYFDVQFSGASTIALEHWAPDASLADVSSCDNAPTETTTGVFAYKHTVCDKQDGTYQALYTATVSGTYNITLRYNSQFFRNSPVSTLVNPATAFADRCVAFGTGLQYGVSRKPATFVIQVSPDFNERAAAVIAMH